MTSTWQTVVFIDMDNTLLHGPFGPAVFPAVLEEMAAKSGIEAAQIRQMIVQENFARQADPAMPAVQAMDWDDIFPAIGQRLGIQVQTNAEQIVRSHAHPPYVTVFENAPEILRTIAAHHRAIILSTKGLAKYQTPILDGVGLTPLFTAILTPDTHLALKKDRAFYGAWPSKTHLQITVGDNYEDDVIAPKQFGFKAVWKTSRDKIKDDGLVDPFERAAACVELQDRPVRPDAIIYLLEELPTVINTLEKQAAIELAPGDTPIIITPFQPTDQEETKNLILAGLVGHWGTLDPTKNPDLNDIATTYANAVFLVGRLGDRIVGSGALVPRADHTAEIIRMSVAADMRRRGIGRMILDQLCEHARSAGYRQIVLETTETWQDAINFYKQYGFHITHYMDGDVYFALDLT